jgi:tetratricopeptide (TPR) repeat protein
MLSSEINYSLGDYEKALSQQLSLLKIESKNDKFGATVRNNLAIMYDASGKFEEALKYVDEQIKLNSGALSLESYKTKCNILRKKGFLDEAKLIYDLILDVFKIIDPNILNSRADYYRTIDAFPNAYLDIYKALEINFDQGVFWATLAEINEAEGKMKEFYLNLRTALEKGMKLEELESTKNIYLKYQNDEKFIDLFVKYGIDFEMIQAL